MSGPPAWVAEDFSCPECGFAFADCDVAGIAARLPTLAADIRQVVEAADPAALRARAGSQTWSAIEYLCHVRDVFQASTIRLYRARTEDEPRLEPLFNDQRAIWFRYAEREPVPVLAELDAAVAGCRDEIARVEDWDRSVMRLPGETRTVRWLARAAVHEAVHHRADIARA